MPATVSPRNTSMERIRRSATPPVYRRPSPGRPFDRSGALWQDRSEEEGHAEEGNHSRREDGRIESQPVPGHSLRQSRLRGRPDRAASRQGELGKDIREQTRNTLERIKVILAAAGTSLDNVLMVTTHLTRREDLAAYNEEYGRHFPDNKPARTT